MNDRDVTLAVGRSGTGENIKTIKSNKRRCDKLEEQEEDKALPAIHGKNRIKLDKF